MTRALLSLMRLEPLFPEDVHRFFKIAAGLFERLFASIMPTPVFS
jgi:hypothetical protein